MRYAGGCHCGRISFEVDAEGEIEGAVACNCSICARKGALLWAVAHNRLRVAGNGADIGSYTFNTHKIAHRFCKTCGIHPYAEDVATGPERAAYINLRCLENFDPKSIPIHDFDGRSM